MIGSIKQMIILITIYWFHGSTKAINPPKRSAINIYGGHGLEALMHNISPRNVKDVDINSWWQSLSRNNTMPCKCGRFSESNDNVKEWEEEGVTSLNMYPWSVSLVAPDGVHAFCGGSLISDRFVLTSAACVDGSNSAGVETLIGTWPRAHFQNIKGEHEDEKDELNLKQVLRKKVVRVIIHPKYRDGHLDYNIALLRLKGPVPTFGNDGGVVPVCLPKSHESFDGFNSSSLLWRFHQGDGYIAPVRRTEVNSRVLSKHECKATNYSEQWENMPDTLICAMTEEPSTDHAFHDTFDCPGDAGGFLLVSRQDQNEIQQKVQIGIDSWTTCFGRPKGIGVFTRVQEFLPWIQLHISEDGRHCSD